MGFWLYTDKYRGSRWEYLSEHFVDTLKKLRQIPWNLKGPAINLDQAGEKVDGFTWTLNF